VDFLTNPLLPAPGGAPPATIFTNPPFDRAEAFVERALMHMMLGRDTSASGRVAMLLPHEWDCARGRADLFDDPAFGFAAKITLRRRIVWIGPDGVPLRSAKRHGPKKQHAWFVWDRRLRRAVAEGHVPAGGSGVLLHQRLVAAGDRGRT